MNPFALPGPEFLGLYVLFASVVALVVAGLRRRGERADVETDVARLDPYALAVLRGGDQEALRVAAFALLERGVLSRTSEGLRSTVPSSAGRSPIESELLRTFEAEQPVRELFSTTGRAEVCAGLRAQLIAGGLLPDEAQTERQRSLRAAALSGLISVAGVKVIVALATGHGNVLLLVGACAVSCVLCHVIATPRRTAAGEALLRAHQLDLEAARSSTPEASTEGAVRLAAAFGLGALPAELYPWLRETFPKMGGASCGGGGCGSGGCGGGGCGGCGGGCGG